MESEKTDRFLAQEEPKKFKTFIKATLGLFKKKQKINKSDIIEKKLIGLIGSIHERVERMEQNYDILKTISDPNEIIIFLPEQVISIPKIKEKELLETMISLKVNFFVKNLVLDTMQIHEKEPNPKINSNSDAVPVKK